MKQNESVWEKFLDLDVGAGEGLTPGRERQSLEDAANMTHESDYEMEWDGLCIGGFSDGCYGWGRFLFVGPNINDRGVDGHGYGFNGCCCPERDSHVGQSRD
jgi:hypothetical protein